MGVDGVEGQDRGDDDRLHVSRDLAVRTTCCLWSQPQMCVFGCK